MLNVDKLLLSVNNQQDITIIKKIPRVKQIVLTKVKHFINPEFINANTIYIIYYGCINYFRSYLRYRNVAIVGIVCRVNIMEYYKHSNSFYLDLTLLDRLSAKYRAAALKYIKKKSPLVAALSPQILSLNCVMYYLLFNKTIREIRCNEDCEPLQYLINGNNNIVCTDVVPQKHLAEKNKRNYFAQLKYVYIILRSKKLPKFISIKIINYCLEYYKIAVRDNKFVIIKMFH